MKIIAQASEEDVIITPEGGERRILSYGGGIMLVQFTFGAGVSAAMHSHPHEQIGYVVSGTIDLIMEGHAPAHLRAGSSYYVAPNVRHGIVTYAPTVLLDFFAPIREDFLAVPGLPPHSPSPSPIRGEEGQTSSPLPGVGERAGG